MISLETLKERVAERYDPDYLVDVLGITSDELLDAFEHKLEQRREAFAEVDSIEDDE